MKDRPSSGLPRALGELSEASAEAKALATSIQQAVEQETGHAIRDLAVEIQPEGVLLKGQCRTYYSKQLAQHAVMALPGTEQVINSIEVG